MKFKITYATNFMRIFWLPNEFPSGFCFGGGFPVAIRIVDWFNPFDQQDFWGDKTKEFDAADEEYLKHIEGLKIFIKEKRYFDSHYTYMALTDYGDAFIINPEKRAGELEEEYNNIVKRSKIMDEKQSINSEEDASLEETLGASDPLFQPETEDNTSKESKYRMKPVVIEAVQYKGNGNVDGGVPVWMFRAFEKGILKATNGGNPLVVKTLAGEVRVSKDDWIIKGVKGEFYPCKPDIFELTYEKVQ